MELMILSLLVLCTGYASALPQYTMDNSVDDPHNMKVIDKVMKFFDYKLEQVKEDYLAMKDELARTTSLVEDLKKELNDLKATVTETEEQSVGVESDYIPDGENHGWPYIRKVVEQYAENTDWDALREGLKRSLDADGVEYNQLLAVDDESWGHLWQVGNSGFHELATLLLDAGLGPNKTDEVGDAMLHGAAEGGQIRMARVLLDRGAGVDQRGWRGLTPFNKAALGGRPEMLKFLAERGARVGSADDDGMTSLHFAAEHGHLPAVELLVSLGLDTGAKDVKGLTPLDWAKRNNHQEVVKYLSSLPH